MSKDDKLKKRLTTFAKYTVSIGLIVLVLARTDLREAIAAVNEVRISMFGLGLLVMVVNTIIRSYKWQLLLRVQGARIPLLRVVHLIFVSMFFNNLFLGSLGGDAFRVYGTIGYSNSKSDAACSVVMERVTGLVSAFLITLLFGVGFIVANETFVSVQLLIGLATVGLVAVFGTVVVVKNQSKIVRRLMLDKIGQLRQIIDSLAESMRAYREFSLTVALAMLLSFLFHLAQSVTVYCFALAVDADVPLLPFFFICPLVGLLVMLPISLNGIGIQESSYIFYFEQIGIAGAGALLIAILSRVASLLQGLIGAVLFLLWGSGRNPRPTTESDNSQPSKSAKAAVS